MIDMYNRTEDEIITIDNRNNSQVLNTEDYSNEEILETNESFISDSQEVGTDNILQTPLENDTQDLYSKQEIDDFSKEATSGNYNHLLQTCMKWVNVY